MYTYITHVFKEKMYIFLLIYYLSLRINEKSIKSTPKFQFYFQIFLKKETNVEELSVKFTNNSYVYIQK